MLRASLEQWRMFLAVVEHGGFNQAAAVVHKSQSSIHHAVQKLEDSLGVKLFQVDGRKTRLTDAGKLMLRRASFLLDEAAQVEAVATSLGEGIETSLRIAVDEVFPTDILYKALDATSTRFPLLQIELIESILTGANELLENLDVDLAISPFSISDVFCQQLCDITFIAVAHPDHPLQQADEPLTLDALKTHRQIVVRDSAVANKHDSGWLGANQRWTVSHIRTSIDMISKGLGFAWLPKHAIENELADGRLTPLPLKFNQQRQGSLFLMMKDFDMQGPALGCFVEELRRGVGDICL